MYYINDTIHHLSYDTNHSFNITVVNCFGEQNSTLLSISEGIYECRINIIMHCKQSFPQLVVILQSIQLMVQSRSIRAQRKEYGFSSTVVRDTIPLTTIRKRCHHNASTLHGSLIHRHWSVSQKVSTVCIYTSFILSILQMPLIVVLHCSMAML